MTYSRSRCPVAARFAAACTVACIACLVPSRRCARGPRARPSWSSPSTARWHAVASGAARARAPRRSSSPGPCSGGTRTGTSGRSRRAAPVAAAVAQLERTPGVRWAELDASLSYDSADAASRRARRHAVRPAGRAGPRAPSRRHGQAADTVTQAACASRRARGQPLHHAGHAVRGAARELHAGQRRRARRRPGERPAVLQRGQPARYYAEEWNNFCFVPQTQAASVTAGAPTAPDRAGRATRAPGTSARRARAR